MEVSISCEPFFNNKNKLIAYVNDIIKLAQNFPLSIHFDLFEYNEEIMQIMGQAAAKMMVNIHSRLTNMDLILNQLTQYKFNSIAIHPEQYSEETLLKIFHNIKQKEIKTGLVFDFETNVQDYQSLIKISDMVTIMTVNYRDKNDYGFKQEALKKISQIKEINPKVRITVDGNINEEIIHNLQGLGVDIIVMGGCAQRHYLNGQLNNMLSDVLSIKFSDCIFCDVLHNQQNKFLKQPLTRQILYQDDDFYIKIGRGSLIPGYLMVIPKEHVPSTANLSQRQHQKLFHLLQQLRGILEKIFAQPVIFFESGTQLGTTKFKNSIVHAHVQVAPIKLSPGNEQLMKTQMFLEPFDYRKQLSVLKNKSYSLFIDDKDNGYVSLSLNRPRQVFRRIIANEIGKDDIWNWREEQNESMDNIIKTMKLLQPALRRINND